MSKKQIRVFLSEDTYQRLVEWADYYGYGLSRACRIIIDSAPLRIPEESLDLSYEEFCKETALEKQDLVPFPEVEGNENIKSLFDDIV